MSKRTLLEILKAAHLAIVAVCVWAVGYVLYCGLVGAHGPLLVVALTIPGLIGLGRYANGVECILQTWARELQGVPKGTWARDITWLPERCARAIPATFTPLYLLGFGLVAGRALERWAG